MWRTAGAASRSRETLLRLSMLAKQPWQEPPTGARRARAAKHALTRHRPAHPIRLRLPMNRPPRKNSRRTPPVSWKTCTAW